MNLIQKLLKQMNDLKQIMIDDLRFYHYYEHSDITIYEWYESTNKRIIKNFQDSIKKIKIESGLTEIYLEGLNFDVRCNNDLIEIQNQFKEELKTRFVFKVAMKFNSKFLQ